MPEETPTLQPPPVGAGLSDQEGLHDEADDARSKGSLAYHHASNGRRRLAYHRLIFGEPNLTSALHAMGMLLRHPPGAIGGGPPAGP